MKQLFIVAGPNGSGKSTFIKTVLATHTQNFVLINPDALARTLFKDEKDDVVRYQKAFKMADFLRDEAFENGKNILIETVNSSTHKDEFYQKCVQNGYEITVYYIATENPEINVERVGERVITGGHSVPKEKIVDRYYKSLERIIFMWNLSKNLYIYDNSQSELRFCVHAMEKNKFLIRKTPGWVKKYFIDLADL